MKAGEHTGRKVSGIYAGIDGCVPGGAAAGAFIDQPYVQVLSLGVDPELSGAYEFLPDIAFFTVSQRSRRPVILYGPFDVFHVVFLSCLPGYEPWSAGSKKCNILTGGYQPNSCLINKVETYRWDQKARTDAEDSHGSGSFLIIYFSFPGL